MLNQYYLPISILIATGALLLFLLRLDRRKTNVRRVVLISVMVALSVLGRLAFAALPYFKPMTAVIILTGLYLGPEAGFLCGSITALLSNIYFGQGPWTPFQMLALGLLGLFAALLSRPLKRHLPLLLLYGAIAGVFYSFFMDIWTALWTAGTFGITAYLAALASAVPVTICYSVSNVVFLLLLAKPIGRKLGRIIWRYRI